jgi:hypothetical protein
MLHSLFRACESFTFVTANRGQLDVTLPWTQNLVVTVLVGSKFGVGWVTTFNHKPYMTFQPLLLGVFFLFPGKFSLLISQWGWPEGYCVFLPDQSVEPNLRLSEMKLLEFEFSWGSHTCIAFIADIHGHIHTLQVGGLNWIIVMNAFIAHYILTTGINLKIGRTKILSAEI